MVRVTGKSLETLYRYIAGQLDGKAPAGHEHTQAQVAGLPDALNGKAAAKHGHAQADVAGLTEALGSAEGYHHLAFRGYCTDANEALQMGIYMTTPDTANVGQYGILICWVSQEGVYNGLTDWLFQEIRETTGQIRCRQKINDGDFTSWTQVFKQGDRVLVRRASCEISVPTTGWAYDGVKDKYWQTFTRDGFVPGMRVYANVKVQNIGGNFPLIGVFIVGNGMIEIAMADVPTISAEVEIDGFFIE